MNQTMTDNEALQALSWLLDQGVDEVLDEAPVDRFAAYEEKLAAQRMSGPVSASVSGTVSGPDVIAHTGLAEGPQARIVQASAMAGGGGAVMPQGQGALLAEALKFCNAAADLPALRAGIEAFKGFDFQALADKLVFADGAEKASIMVIGDFPREADDHSGLSFDPEGAEGALLDKILASIQLSRENVYLTQLCPWRPPGNRSLTPAEIALCLPLLERHIALVKPEFLMILGATAAQALLGKKEGISRLRKASHSYETQSDGLAEKISGLDAFVFYHPDYLLQTPIQKRAMWGDLLRFDKYKKEKTGQAG